MTESPAILIVGCYYLFESSAILIVGCYYLYESSAILIVGCYYLYESSGILVVGCYYLYESSAIPHNYDWIALIEGDLVESSLQNFVFILYFVIFKFSYIFVIPTRFLGTTA